MNKSGSQAWYPGDWVPFIGTGTSGGKDGKFYFGHVHRHPGQTSNMELKSNA